MNAVFSIIILIAVIGLIIFLLSRRENARHAGRVPAAEAGSAPHQIKNGKTLFFFAFFCYTIRCGSARALPQP